VVKNIVGNVIACSLIMAVKVEAKRDKKGKIETEALYLD
jgi:hypothetical protein